MTLALVGTTALVTGASAGIGREIARVLAREVGTLILVARRRERLDELSAELLARRAGLRVLVRAVDLADRAATGALLDALEAEGERVDVLVNNAGFGEHGLFDESPWPKLEQLLELNVVSATFVLHRLLPGMIARRSGAVLNVGSSAGVFPTPGMGVYAASKAYVNHLNEVLVAELAGTGVTATALCPGPVPTEFQEVAGSAGKNPLPAAFRIDAERCAEDAVEAMKRGAPRLIPGGPMRAITVSFESLPKVLVRGGLRRMARGLRRR